jgi:hypothetical protein
LRSCLRLGIASTSGREVSASAPRGQGGHHATLTRSQRATLPKSQLGKALTYLETQAEPLAVFLRDPKVEIHNNDSERALRHVVTGRKNWLFFGSPRGGEVGSRLFSLLATCKALDVHPEHFLEDVIRRIDTTPASQIAKLTPWAWAEERAKTAAD